MIPHSQHFNLPYDEHSKILVYVDKDNDAIDYTLNFVTASSQIPKMFTGSTVKLMAGSRKTSNRINNPGELKIFDLIGNGVKSSFQNQGIGTALVNSLIAFIKVYHPSNLPISGVISPNEDSGPNDETIEKLARKRIKFWESFGLEVFYIPDDHLPQLRGTVGSIQQRRDPFTNRISPITPTFTDFELLPANNL